MNGHIICARSLARLHAKVARTRFLCEGGAREDFFSSYIFLVYFICIQ